MILPSKANVELSSDCPIIPSVHNQISHWKEVFDTLMEHPCLISGIDPQSLPLCVLPSEIKKIYETKLEHLYFFIGQHLKENNDFNLLKQFYHEDQRLLNTLEMTHELFIYSTFRLSILMDRENILKNTIVEHELKEMIISDQWKNISFYKDIFAPRVFKLPDYPMSLIAPILLPEGELEIRAFLDAFLLHDYPFGLAAVPTNSTYVHGGTMGAPGLFFSHDLLHWPVFEKLANRYPGRWEKLKNALRILYINNDRDDILDYFIFMILHEGALEDQFGLSNTDASLGENIEFLITQIPSEMKNRFDYHRSFLKNFLLAKLQSVTDKPFKLYSVDEIDEQRLDVIHYTRTSSKTYDVFTNLSSKGKVELEIRCQITIKDTGEKYFCNCEITEIEIVSYNAESEYDPEQVKKDLYGEINVKNPRYFFYIDVKDHLMVVGSAAFEDLLKKAIDRAGEYPFTIKRGE
jgi:hypothetical protein